MVSCVPLLSSPPLFLSSIWPSSSPIFPSSQLVPTQLSARESFVWAWSCSSFPSIKRYFFLPLFRGQALGFYKALNDHPDCNRCCVNKVQHFQCLFVQQLLRHKGRHKAWRVILTCLLFIYVLMMTKGWSQQAEASPIPTFHLFVPLLSSHPR